MKGKFITLEGIDGSGKTTALKIIKNYLEAQGKKVYLTKEPGGNNISEEIRQILLKPRVYNNNFNEIYPLTEAFLLFAARNQNVIDCIKPKLAEGYWVVCDRFTDSSFAYQVGGCDLNYEIINTMAKWVHKNLIVDLTILLDIEPSIYKTRIFNNDRIEQKGLKYMTKVHNYYLQMSKKNKNIKVIKNQGSVIDLTSKIESLLINKFNELN